VIFVSSLNWEKTGSQVTEEQKD